MSRLARTFALAWLLALAGCYANPRPWNPTPLPASAARETEGGEVLDLDERGALFVGWRPGDIEAALGVDLVAAVGSGARVAALRPRPAEVAPVGTDTPEAAELRDRRALHLEVGDVIVHAMPIAPWLGEIPPAPAVRPWPGMPLPTSPGLYGIPVGSPDDLRGLACGLRDLVLDLVVRRGDHLFVVRQALRPIETVGAAPWALTVTRGLGCDAVTLEDLPPGRRPRGAERGDVLITAVAAGSPAARAGLRPLDLLRGEGGALDLRTGATPLPPGLAEQRDAALEADPALRVTRVVSPAGAAREVVLPALRAPSDSGLPLLWAWEDDGARWRFGLGPFDWLFHASGRADYDALSDTHARTTRWSVLTIFQVQSIDGGSARGAQVRIDPLTDEARMRYVLERMSDEP